MRGGAAGGRLLVGVFVRILHGSARNFVVYTDQDPYNGDVTVTLRFHPEGIRLLTVRPLW